MNILMQKNNPVIIIVVFAFSIFLWYEVSGRSARLWPITRPDKCHVRILRTLKQI